MRIIVTAIWDALRDFGAMVAIVLLCIGAAVVYGVCHDQITARVCIEYFSVFHPIDVLPHGMNPNSPTEQGFFWGVFATWWMGMLIRVPLSILARIGTAKPLSTRDLIRPVGVLLGTMAVFAFVAGLIGYFLSSDGSATVSSFPAVADKIPPSHRRGFLADYLAHNTSYLVGGAGGFVLLLHTALMRWRRPKTGCVTESERLGSRAEANPEDAIQVRNPAKYHTTTLEAAFAEGMDAIYTGPIVVARDLMAFDV